MLISKGINKLQKQIEKLYLLSVSLIIINCNYSNNRYLQNSNQSNRLSHNTASNIQNQNQHKILNKGLLNTLLKSFIGFSLINQAKANKLNDHIFNNHCQLFENKILCEKMDSRCVWDDKNDICDKNIDYSKVITDKFISKRRLGNDDCKSFNEDPRDPGGNVYVDDYIWMRPQVCKLFIEFPDYSTTCTGSIVGPYHLLTARHCSLNGCNQKAVKAYAACGYGYIDYVHNYFNFGSVEIEKCIFLKEYDDAINTKFNQHSQCNYASNFKTGIGYDIQICRLKSKFGEVMHNFNYSYFTLDPKLSTSINVEGYPGYNPGLEKYIPKYQYKRLIHPWIRVTNYTDNVLQLAYAWVFSGESGAPYHYFSSNYESLEVIGVHNGGATGCDEFGTRVTPSLIHKFKEVLGIPIYTNKTWEDPQDHCQIINYNVDFLYKYGYPLKGVGRDNPYYIYTEQYKDFHFVAKITLLNLGTKDAKDVDIIFYSSIDNKTKDSVNNLGSVHIDHISAYETSIVQKDNLIVDWPSHEVRHISATWRADDCINDPYNNYTYIGKVKSFDNHGHKDKEHKDSKSSSSKKYISYLITTLLNFILLKRLA
ncbi:MAG: trypsin-like serine protease [Bacteroidetes bacterium]|nr:trypsin-like serine protease [Bacteroidota bacterium]